MKCMIIKVNPNTQDIIVHEGLYYSYDLPQDRCNKVLVVGPQTEDKQIPLLAVCNKVTVDRRIGQVHPAFGPAQLGSSWDYVWYLTVEKRFKNTCLPAGADICDVLALEMSLPAVHFTSWQIEGLAELGVTETDANILAATPEAEALHQKQANKAAKAKEKREKAKAARSTRTLAAMSMAAAAAPVKPSIPVELPAEDRYQVGDQVQVEVGLGAMRKSYQGTVAVAQDRFAKHPETGAEICIDQVISVEIEPGQLKKFSAKAMRQNEKKREEAAL